jgi:hypothetical protein
MKREQPPARQFTARELLRAMREVPAPRPGCVRVFTTNGWLEMTILPGTKLRFSGEGLLVPDFDPSLTREERIKLWEEHSEKVHAENRRIMEEEFRDLLPQHHYPEVSRRTPQGDVPSGPSTSTEPLVQSSTGVKLAKPSAEEIRNAGRRKGGFSRSGRLSRR